MVVNTNDNIDKWDENWHDNSRQIFYNSIDFFEEDGITYVLHDNKQSSVVRITINNKNVKILEKIIYNQEEYLVTTIETGACLNNLYITEFIIPNNIISIKKRAFVNNELLEKVYIPKSVLYLEENIFAVCEKIIIYTEHLEKPDGWSDDWNKENKEVIWNYQN